jgi:starch synthase
MGKGSEWWMGIQSATLAPGLELYCLDRKDVFEAYGIYDDAPGLLGCSGFRFALLARAALQLAIDLDLKPDVAHGHDWPTAILAAYLAPQASPLGPLDPLRRTASVLTIHNLFYQGRFASHLWPWLHLPDSTFRPDAFEDLGSVNLLKGGLAFADELTTVSPTHAKEICTEAGGHGLSPLLRARQDVLSGILNGVDGDWNPESDSRIPARYAARNLLGKLECKRALKARFRLGPGEDLPIFGLISRFAPQKGLDLLRAALPAALERWPIQFVALGAGDPGFESFLRELEIRHPGKVGTFFGYDEDLSHWIEAGSDFYLMPSRYEPCGLNQMYSMRYGTLPLVRATGGLADTVEDYDAASGAGTGFVFEQATAEALLSTIERAVRTWFTQPGVIARLRRQAMAKHFPWGAAAERYEEVYERAIARRRADEAGEP